MRKKKCFLKGESREGNISGRYTEICVIQWLLWLEVRYPVHQNNRTNNSKREVCIVDAILDSPTLPVSIFFLRFGWSSQLWGGGGSFCFFS